MTDEERARILLLELHDEFQENDVRNIAAALGQVRAEEAEACASFLKQVGRDWWAECDYRKSDAADYLADAIRARHVQGPQG